MEAKRRGLSCGIKQATTSNGCEDNPAVCSESTLCKRATYKGGWVTSGDGLAFTNEARSRGLSCGIKRATTSNNCENNPAVCSEATLCKRATYKGGWITSGDGLAFTNEARSRGLSCGASSAQKSNKSSFETYFKNLSFSKRTQIQYSLKNLGYYKMGVDGLWGQGTARGLDKFKRENNLTGSTNNYVVQTLNKKAERNKGIKSFAEKYTIKCTVVPPKQNPYPGRINSTQYSVDTKQGSLNWEWPNIKHKGWKPIEVISSNEYYIFFNDGKKRATARIDPRGG